MEHKFPVQSPDFWISDGQFGESRQYLALFMASFLALCCLVVSRGVFRIAICLGVRWGSGFTRVGVVVENV